ncbi:hypothetical protein F5884DRAFT_851549 [Xylogone sp. PMI_703]|nr:hypothetical protein F5884DRAFT_851549 [Xylogone sp. PMI_703]
MTHHRQSRGDSCSTKDSTLQHVNYDHLRCPRLSGDLRKAANREVEHGMLDGQRDMNSGPLPTLDEDTNHITEWLLQVKEQTCPSVDCTRLKGYRESYLGHDLHVPSELAVTNHANSGTFCGRDYDSNADKKRNNNTSDSSLIEESLASRPPILLSNNIAIEMKEKRNTKSSNDRGKYSFSGSEEASSTASKISDSRPRLFEKRPRRRTREDHYQPRNKRNKAEKTHVHGSKKTRKKSGQSKLIGVDAENLMHNFSSENIGSGRLTMRRHHGPGLFNNGRASASMRRQGLPDLAFSEMKFLQNDLESISQPEFQQQISTTQERKRTQSVQNEISTYFKPTPLELCSTRPLSRLSSTQACVAKIRAIRKRHRLDNSLFPSSSVEVLGTPVSEATSSNIMPVFSPTSSLHSPRCPTESVAETTTISWPETQYPSRTEDDAYSNHSRARSSTPRLAKSPINKNRTPSNGEGESVKTLAELKDRRKSAILCSRLQESTIISPRPIKDVKTSSSISEAQGHSKSPSQPNLHHIDVAIQTEPITVALISEQVTIDDQGGSSKTRLDQYHINRDSPSLELTTSPDVCEHVVTVPEMAQVADELRVKYSGRIPCDSGAYGTNETILQQNNQIINSNSEVDCQVLQYPTTPNPLIEGKRKARSQGTTHAQNGIELQQEHSSHIEELEKPCHLHVYLNEGIPVSGFSYLSEIYLDRGNENFVAGTSQHVAYEQLVQKDNRDLPDSPAKGTFKIPKEHTVTLPFYTLASYKINPSHAEQLDFDSLDYQLTPHQYEYLQDEPEVDAVQIPDSNDFISYGSVKSREYDPINEFLEVDHGWQECDNDAHSTLNHAESPDPDFLQQDIPCQTPYHNTEAPFTGDYGQQKFSREILTACQDLSIMQKPCFSQTAVESTSGQRFWQPYLQY